MPTLFEPVVGVFEELERREEQERTKYIECPAEVLNECCAQQDEDKPQHQRQPHTYQQRLASQLPRNCELAKDNKEYKDVIDRERFLGYVAREVLLGKLWTPDTTDDEGEQQRQNDIDSRLNSRLSKSGLMRVSDLVNKVNC